MNGQKKLTIITVCYNASDVIEKTILSVLSQNKNLFEYLIIDGKSTDSTLNICKKYSEYLSIYSEKDNGIFDAMNKGIKLAKGEWIIFMNAGDLFYNENVLNNVFNQKFSDKIGFIFGDTYLNNSTKQKMTPFVFNKRKLSSMGICHQSIFVRTKLAQNNLFDLNYKVAADYNMIRKIYEAGWGYLYINTPISIFDTTGYSSQNRIRQLDEVAMICGQTQSITYHFQRFYLKFKLKIKHCFKHTKS